MAATAGSLDFTRTAPKRLKALGISTNFFGALVGVDSGTISNIFSGKKKISGQKTIEYSQTISDLELVAYAFHPAPISFKDVELIRDLIRQLKDGSLLVGIVSNGSMVIMGREADSVTGSF